MFATLTITRRRFSALSPLFCCAVSLFLFFFSTNAEASFDENIGRSLLQDHSSAHAEWHGMRMDERGELWDRVGRHFDHGNNRREEEDGPLRCLLNNCGDQTRDCIHSKPCRDFMRCQLNCGRENRRTERKDVDGLEFNPTKCAFACVREQSESDAVKKFSLCTITSGCSLPLQ